MGRPPALAVLVIVAVVVLWRQGQVRLIPFVVLTPLLGSLVNSAVKITVDRPRPEVDHPIATAFGKSFPSGHSFSSVVTYGVLLVAFLPVVAAGQAALRVGADRHPGGGHRGDPHAAGRPLPQRRDRRVHPRAGLPARRHRHLPDVEAGGAGHEDERGYGRPTAPSGSP